MKYICRHVCFILLFSLYSMLFCLFNFVVVLLMHFHFHYCSYCIFLLLLTWCSCSSRSPECLMPVYTLFRTIWRSPSWTETWRPTRLQPAFARKHAVHLVGWIQWWSMMLPCNHSHFFHVFFRNRRNGRAQVTELNRHAMTSFWKRSPLSCRSWWVGWKRNAQRFQRGFPDCGDGVGHWNFPVTFHQLRKQPWKSWQHSGLDWN